jgi:hypothetical protein
MLSRGPGRRYPPGGQPDSPGRSLRFGRGRQEVTELVEQTPEVR